MAFLQFRTRGRGSLRPLGRYRLAAILRFGYEWPFEGPLGSNLLENGECSQLFAQFRDDVSQALVYVAHKSGLPRDR
jgi:hypothetical protein